MKNVKKKQAGIGSLFVIGGIGGLLVVVVAMAVI
jgi:hypothetical protein